MSVPVFGISLIVTAAAIESFAQVALKLGAGGRALWVLVGVLLYVLEVAVYTVGLHRVPVSVAFPLGSLCFVGVALLSRLFLGEKVGWVRSVGVACILAGAVCVTR